MTAARQTGGRMLPDAGGSIRAGVQEPGKVYLAVERFQGTGVVELDLDPTEAQLLASWLIKLADPAKTRSTP